MDNTNPRPPAGAFLTLPMSLGLLVLFFTPWLKVSCNPQAATNAAELRGMQDAPAELIRPGVLARASGWDLARGQLTPDERFKPYAAQENAEGPLAKRWAYGGLILPALLAGLALLGLAGRLTVGGAAKGMLLLGIAGVVIMSLAASMDYIDEAMDQAKGQMAAAGAPLKCAAFRQNVATATDQAKQVIQTTATPYLWACLGMYVVIGGYGLVALGGPEYVPPPQEDAFEETEAPGLSLGPALPKLSRDRRPRPGPTDLGPSLPPRKVPAPVTGDKPDSQT